MTKYDTCATWNRKCRPPFSITSLVSVYSRESLKSLRDRTSKKKDNLIMASAVAESLDTPPITADDDITCQALVQYLRAEADAADQRARSLREQAAQLSALHGITPDVQQRYEINPDELPPMDEHGVPKYKGRKRGRKPKVRKRKANPERRKRQHTAYTFFVQERYPGVRMQHPDWPSKDLISLVAKQWANVPAEEKKEWKQRAVATHVLEHSQEPEMPPAEDDMEDEKAEVAVATAGINLEDETEEYEEAQEIEEEEEEEEEDAAPPARRRTRRS